jgi:hypothetical protein
MQFPWINIMELEQKQQPKSVEFSFCVVVACNCVLGVTFGTHSDVPLTEPLTAVGLPTSSPTTSQKFASLQSWIESVSFDSGWLGQHFPARFHLISKGIATWYGYHKTLICKSIPTGEDFSIM